MGVSSGICYGLLVSTFTAYLSDYSIPLAMIGFLSLRSLPYSFKYVWAPLVDHIHIKLFPKHFGQRKSWLVSTQFCKIIIIITMGMVDIQTHLYLVFFLACVIAFLAATFDIAMDAYRIELSKVKKYINLTSFNLLGFRVGFLISGAFGLYLSTFVAWQWVFIIIACCIVPCMVVVFFSEDDSRHRLTNNVSLYHWCKRNVTIPFLLLFRTKKIHLILLVIIFYKVSDGYVFTMLMPFLEEMSFSKLDIALIFQTLGLISTMAGTFFGGYLIKKYKMLKILVLAEFLIGISNLLFILVISYAGNRELLSVIIFIENFCAGISSIALIHYMSSLCKHSRFTATHYAILISISGFSRIILGSGSGFIAMQFGWTNFFIISALFSIPSLICILLLKDYMSKL